MPATVDPGRMALLSMLQDLQQNVRKLQGQQNRPLNIANAPARMWLTGAYSAGTGFGIIPFDTVSFDPAGCLDTTNHVYTVQQPGYYQVNGCFGGSLQNATLQIWIASIRKNGLEIARGDRVAIRTGTVGDIWNIHASEIVQCAAGDTISLDAYNGGPTATGLEQLASSTFMSVVRVA